MKPILTIIGVLLALLFVLGNLDTVEISLVVGRPLEVPLSLIVTVTFLAGFFVGVALRLKRRGRQESLEDE
ncbi:MAG: hypothetical protein WCJ64_11355 [Rhodospirillaceae bacterium]